MIRLTIATAATLIALAAAMPAQAAGPWFSQNGVSLNGLALNGRNMQGRSMQGVQPNGIELQVTGGVSLLAIELAQ